jgi:hypothetical protein
MRTLRTRDIQLTCDRIIENQHLLDATEIFRKLNVHKKVWLIINALVPVRKR